MKIIFDKSLSGILAWCGVRNQDDTTLTEYKTRSTGPLDAGTLSSLSAGYIIVCPDDGVTKAKSNEEAILHLTPN